jgi:hypothetical protein
MAMLASYASDAVTTCPPRTMVSTLIAGMV